MKLFGKRRVFRWIPRVSAITLLLLFLYQKGYNWNFNFWSTLVEEDDPEFPTDLLINTTNCKIPHFPPWTLVTRALPEKKCTNFFKGPPKCEEKQSRVWSQVKDSYMHINLTAVRDSGYSWNSIRCCYRVIMRVEQGLDESDMNADKIIRYSDQCFPINTSVQYIPASFIRVHCISTSFPSFGDVVYRQFFAIAHADANYRKKVERWATIKKFKESLDKQWITPPNVIILGVDTMSRLNAHRHFTQSLAVLRSMGAVELKAYTKVGESTIHNVFALLTGYTIRELEEYCHQQLYTPMDLCPFIWKRFSRMGYVTVLLDDEPHGSEFNGLKKGFVRKPTDFYFRPFMLAVLRHTRRESYSYLRCLEGQQLEQVQLNYLQDILRLAEKSGGIPVFARAWFAALAHQCTPSAKYGDHLFAEYLERLVTSHKNSIIIFMGDHGETYGELRETVQGWYEDKLPMMWVYLPEQIRDKFPEWYSSLRVNANRVTSHFDLYKTFLHILTTFGKDNILEEVNVNRESENGQSLFLPVPENRSCSDAEIHIAYCPCFPPADADVTDDDVVKAVEVAVKELIDLLPKDLCEVPKLQKIVSARSFITPGSFVVFVVSFYTDPGSFLFEATVKHPEYERERMELAGPMLRMNKMGGKASCVSDKLNKYCYCK